MATVIPVTCSLQEAGASVKTPDSFDVVTGKYCNMMSYADSANGPEKGVRR